MTTTFVLQPDDYTAITFYAVLPEGVEGGVESYNYDMLLSSLQLNEEQRMQFEYAQYENREGGEWKETRSPLVPISFTGRIIGLGATLDVRLANLLQKSAELMRAVTNSNGYLKYKPDGLAVGIMDTYYRYVQSTIPRPASGEAEYWGRTRATVGSTVYINGVPTRQFEITLMTHPFGMSDPDTPVLVKSATTLNDIDDGTNDYLTVTNAVVKGSIPALTRVLVHPNTASVAIDRLWIAKRIDGLASFVSTYNTAAAVDPTSVWSTVADATRCDGAYYRCTPVVNDIVYAIRYTIANWSSHRGRAAILAVIRNNGSSVSDFNIYYRWTIAHYPLQGKNKNSEFVEQWEPILLGEVDLPSTEMSELESLDLYIDVCVVRKTGTTGTFDIDCIKLLYTDEAAIQVDMPTGYGAGTTHDFLLENFDEEVAHVINHSDQKLQYLANPYGDFPTLEPDCDTRLDFAWRRRASDNVTDSMSGYSQYWAGVEDFEVGSWLVDPQYAVFSCINWRAGIEGETTTNPTDVSNGGFDSSTLIGAGKLRADYNDLRVYVDGVEKDRWLNYSTPANTKIWCNVDFVAGKSFTIANDIGATGAVTSITVNEPINSMPTGGYGRILLIGTELFTYTSKSDATKTFLGVVRARYGSSMAAHTAGNTAYWIQHEIYIMYGDDYAAAPSVSDTYKPIIDMQNSTNGVWIYSEFGNGVVSTEGVPATRTGSWHLGVLGISFVSPYTGNHTANADPWTELGLAVQHEGTQRWMLTHMCNISSVNFSSGEKMRQGSVTWSADVAGYRGGVGFVETVSIASPSAINTWESWSVNKVYATPVDSVALRFSPTWILSNNWACLECSDVTVTLDNTTTPLVTLMPEKTWDVTTYAVEGSHCTVLVVNVAAGETITMTAPNPFLFLATDFLCFYMHMTTDAGSTGQTIRIRLKVNDTNYYTKAVSKAQAGGSDGDYYEYHLLSGFAATGSPTLDTVTVIEFYCTTNAGSCTFYFDDVRMSKADPDSAVIYNDTYDEWDFPSGTWHIYELATIGKTLGQIDDTVNVEKVALLHTDYGGDNKYSARCQAKRDAGHAGLVFRASDGTGGSEDMYAVYLDTADDLLRFSKFAGGAETVLASAAYTFDVNTDYYIGVFAKGTTIQCYVSTAAATLWDTVNRLINTTDATYTTGQVGLITCNTLGRFTDITLEQSVNRHLPSDQIQVTIYAWFRTVYPFYEAAS